MPLDAKKAMASKTPLADTSPVPFGVNIGCVEFGNEKKYSGNINTKRI
jgi:hypothetical protein